MKVVSKKNGHLFSLHLKKTTLSGHGLRNTKYLQKFIRIFLFCIDFNPKKYSHNDNENNHIYLQKMKNVKGMKMSLQVYKSANI